MQVVETKGLRQNKQSNKKDILSENDKNLEEAYIKRNKGQNLENGIILNHILQKANKYIANFEKILTIFQLIS